VHGGVQYAKMSKSEKEEYRQWRACTMLLEAVQRADENILLSIGFQRRGDDGVVYNMINNSPIDIRHMDHLICKMSYTESMTTGSRLVSVFPALSQPYGWPVNDGLAKVYNNIPFLEELCARLVAMVDAHDDETEYLFGTIPSCFTFEGEAERREHLELAIKEILGNADQPNTGAVDAQGGQPRQVTQPDVPELEVTEDEDTEGGVLYDEEEEEGETDDSSSCSSSSSGSNSASTNSCASGREHHDKDTSRYLYTY
jgi:hypothetical protein